MKYLTFNIWHLTGVFKPQTVCVVSASPLKEPSESDRRGPVVVSASAGTWRRPTPGWIRAYDDGCRTLVVGVGFGGQKVGVDFYVKNEFQEINEYLLAVDLRKD